MTILPTTMKHSDLRPKMKNNFIEHLNAHLDNQTKTIDSIKSTTRTVEGTCGRAYMHAVGLSAQKSETNLGFHVAPSTAFSVAKLYARLE